MEISEYLGGRAGQSTEAILSGDAASSGLSSIARRPAMMEYFFDTNTYIVFRDIISIPVQANRLLILAKCRSSVA